jgi:hypothetical protein
MCSKCGDKRSHGFKACLLQEANGAKSIVIIQLNHSTKCTGVYRCPPGVEYELVDPHALPLSVTVKQFNLNRLPKGAKVLSMPGGVIQRREAAAAGVAVTGAVAGSAAAVAVTGAVLGAGADRSSRKRTIGCISGEDDSDDSDDSDGAGLLALPEGIIQLQQVVGLRTSVPTPVPEVTPAAAAAVAVTGAVVGAWTPVSFEDDDDVIDEDDEGIYYGFSTIS